MPRRMGVKTRPTRRGRGGGILSFSGLGKPENITQSATERFAELS